MNEPTQTQFKLRAAIRTIIQLLLGSLTAIALREVPWLGEILIEHGESLIVDPVTGGIIMLLSGVWTWIMAQPAVNNFLTKFNLGAQPKRALIED